MKIKLVADGLGLVVPMNIEAMCVADKLKERFQPEPYDFTELPDANSKTKPFLSEGLITKDLRPMLPGVHLHWALPDGLTKGASRQDGEGSVVFPKTPDRWLVTRVYADLSNPAKPVNKIKSWVVESNYISDKPDRERPSLAVPYKTEGTGSDKKLYRFLGRVLAYETWRSNHLQKLNGTAANTDDKYADGLSAIGYGSPTFSASYSTSKSAFGFFDTDKDLKPFGNDIMLSYHVVGWYHNEGEDPLNQLPLQFTQADFKRLLEKASAQNNKILNNFYQVHLQDGAYVLKKGINNDEQLSVINALSASGFDFLDGLLRRCKWSLPSATRQTKPNITHTLYTGLITNVKWNRSESAFRELKKGMRIAVGNTASEALAALMTNVSSLPDPKGVEWLLNALQLGKLKDLSAFNLDRTEQLNTELHTSGFNSSGGGGFWELTKIENEKDKKGLKGLAKSLGTELNELNNLQLNYDRGLNEIESARTQIFMDWYRFIQLLRRDPKDPTPQKLVARDVRIFIKKQLKKLQAKIDDTNPQAIDKKAEAIKQRLPPGYQLLQSSALRYWQPAEPVILFQGDEITPSERYGGDGRFMADKSLVCRLSSQVVNKLVIPKGMVGNNAELVFDEKNAPHLPTNMPLPHANQFYALFTESCLLNPLVLSLLCKDAGSISGQIDIENILKTECEKYLIPVVPSLFSATTMERIKSTVSTEDYKFLLSFCEKEEDNYVLKLPASDPEENVLKRVRYMLISASIGPESKMEISGIMPSPVHFVRWDKNPWLPYLLSWKVNYRPVAGIKPDSAKDVAYDTDFITKDFTLDYADNKHNGNIGEVVQLFQNSIFLTPHAEENFEEQIKKYTEGQSPESVATLVEIKKQLKKLGGVLSQSLNGFNDGLIMRDQVMQLQVTDLVEDELQKFTNETVRDSVGNMTKSAPKPSNYYNPIRAGYMHIESLTIVDAFGYTLKLEPQTYSNVIIAENLKPKAENLKPEERGHMYLAPRIAQPSRLQFRWLSADHGKMESNSHPGTTPICGWIMANHLQPGLWFYRAEGTAIGSLSLSEDRKNVLWQVAPVEGSGTEATLFQYFETESGKKVNEEIKNLVIALYNNNDGTYLNDFLESNDLSFRTIKPNGYQQLGSNAVLMSSPIAVAQVSLGIQLKGSPAYSNGWADLKKEVDQSATDEIERVENGFTKVKFPVRLGKTIHTNDGLLGYFKTEDAYKVYRAMEVGGTRSGMVKQSTDKDIQLALQDPSHETVVTLLLDPRGAVHATTGILPAKAIDILPSLYADALENLNMAFLTSPVLYAMPGALMPVPAQSGGEWSWLQKELEVWASQQILPVDGQARLSDVPQEIREGWLLLTNNKK